MADYQQLNDPMSGTLSETVLRRADSAYIPPDPSNRDRQMYEEWDAIEGNDPDPPDAIPPITVIASFDFLQRFTRNEQLELQNAANTDATIGAGLTSLSTSNQVDLEGSAISNWLDALIQSKVITASRKAELLAPVQPGTAQADVWR